MDTVFSLEYPFLKRKNTYEESPESKKRCIETTKEDATTIEAVINDCIPHIGEQIFESLDPDDLTQCLKVSTSWRALAAQILPLKKLKTCFVKACENGQKDIGKVLLEHSNGQDQHRACRHGHKDLFKVLDRSQIVDLKARILETEDLVQCLKGSKCLKALTVRILLQRWKGEILEACKTAWTEVVQVLLENSEDVELNVQDSYGNTPLMNACKFGRKDTVELLLAHSATNLNAATNILGTTAFMEACMFGHLDTIKLFLDHHSNTSIDFNAENDRGKTAFQLACDHRIKKVVQLILKYSKTHNIEIPPNFSWKSLDFYPSDYYAIQQPKIDSTYFTS